MAPRRCAPTSSREDKENGGGGNVPAASAGKGLSRKDGMVHVASKFRQPSPVPGTDAAKSVRLLGGAAAAKGAQGGAARRSSEAHFPTSRYLSPKVPMR